jgi:flagellar protein FliO/FliZ
MVGQRVIEKSKSPKVQKSKLGLLDVWTFGRLLAVTIAATAAVAQELPDPPMRDAAPRAVAVRDSPPTISSNQSVSIDGESLVRPDSMDAARVAPPNDPQTEPSIVPDAQVGSPLTPADSANPHRSLLRGLRKRSSSDFGIGSNEARSTPWYRTGLGALAVVLGLIATLYVFARRWLPSARIGGDDGVMRVVGRTALSPRQSLALVRVGRRFVVVGVSPDRVDAVCDITDSDEVADLAAQSSAKGLSGSSGFATWLNREAADYVQPDREAEPIGRSEDLPNSTVDKGLGAVSKPLAELLHRLRAMQSSK